MRFTSSSQLISLQEGQRQQTAIYCGDNTTWYFTFNRRSAFALQHDHHGGVVQKVDAHRYVKRSGEHDHRLIEQTVEDDQRRGLHSLKQMRESEGHRADQSRNPGVA